MNIPVYETKPFEQNDKKMWRGGYYDICYGGRGGVRVVVFNTTFNNNSVISWRSVLLVEETGIRVDNHRPVAASH